MALIRLGLNEDGPKTDPDPAPADAAAAPGGETDSGGLNVGALADAPKYNEFIPSMHSNMTMTSPLPPQEPEFAPDAPLEEKVVAVLKTCYDPEIPVDIYQLGLIYRVHAPISEEQPEKVKVVMTLTSPNCPAAQTLPAEVKYKIERLQEVESAAVDITFEPAWTPEKMSDEAKLALNLF